MSRWLLLISLPVAIGGCGQSVPQSAARRDTQDAVAANEVSFLPKPAISSHERMLAKLRETQVWSAEENQFLGERRARELRSAVSNAISQPDVERCRLLSQLGEAELRLGREAAAIDAYTESYSLLRKLEGQIPPREAVEMLFEMGIAYMRVGETQNCCARNSPDACIVPIRGDGIHQNKKGSEQAIQYFTVVLRSVPSQSRMHYQARWLLNIAYMTLDRYPADVPAEFLIPPSAFESEEEFPRFVNIAEELGLATFSLSGGVIADDFDNDGFLDLMVSCFDMSGQLQFFQNNQDGTFKDRTAVAGLTGLFGGLNIVQTDYNEDGHTDIFVLRGAWMPPGGHPNSLIRNNGDGTFTDVSYDVGLGQDELPTQTGSWADYDRDGDLDVYIGNEASRGHPLDCQLFRNNGNETFTNVAEEAGVTNGFFTKAVIFGDYDGDQWPDIYASNYQGENRLYRNRGDATFTDVAPALGVTKPIKSFPAWFWDFDNDGHLDIFVGAYSVGIDQLALASLGLPVTEEIAKLYRGDGAGGFEDVTHATGLTRPTSVMGSNFGDLDNDGFLDFYLGTGYPAYEELLPNQMYHNQRGQRFADVTMAGGFGNLQKGHAVAFVDRMNNGIQDVFEKMGGALKGDKFYDVLYQNPGFGNHWLALKLVGTRSIRSAMGAKIRLEIVENGQRRSVYRHVNSGGTFGANPLRQTIGIGKATKIERLSIVWPGDGQTQEFHDVLPDQQLVVVEGKDSYKVLGPDRRESHQ
jgi:hypothetical protein